MNNDLPDWLRDDGDSTTLRKWWCPACQDYTASPDYGRVDFMTEEQLASYSTPLYCEICGNFFTEIPDDD